MKSWTEALNVVYVNFKTNISLVEKMCPVSDNVN